MKKILLSVLLVSFLISCNMNPSKEARIQKLETEIITVTNKVEEIEEILQKLQIENKALKQELTILKSNLTL